MSRSNQATAQSAPCDEADKAEADLDHEHNHNEQEANKMATVGGREQLRVLLDFVGKGDVLNHLERYGEALNCFERAAAHQNHTQAPVHTAH